LSGTCEFLPNIGSGCVGDGLKGRLFDEVMASGTAEDCRDCGTKFVVDCCTKPELLPLVLFTGTAVVASPMFEEYDTAHGDSVKVVWTLEGFTNC
jgi:hypothetical protein